MSRITKPFSTYLEDHKSMLALSRRIADEHMCEADRATLGIELANLVKAILEDEEAAPEDDALPNSLRLLRQSYVTLAFAFRRLHESPRSRDGELCLDFQKVRAEIEKFFKDQGAPL